MAHNNSTRPALTSEFSTPAAPETEAAVLGAMLIETTAQSEAINLLSVDMFVDGRNALVFQAIRELYDSAENIDLYTVGNKLKIDNNLAKVGGMSGLVGLTTGVGSANNVMDHVQILTEKKIARELQMLGVKLINGAACEDIDDLLTETTSLVDKITSIGMAQGQVKHISLSLAKAIAEAESRAAAAENGKTYGIPTGIRTLDSWTNGWQRGELTILAGRPAMGKTAVSLHFAKTAALMGRHVLIFALEMSEVSLSNRLLLSECETLTYADFRRGSRNPLYWNEINHAQDRIAKLPIFTDTTSSTTMRQIRAKAEAKKRKGECDIIIIDYLQLVNNSLEVKGRNREQEVAAISKASKQLAKDLDVPVIMLSQMTREVEGRAGAKPLLKDLRDSGAIEQDADNVIFIYRPERYGIKEADGLSTRSMGVFMIEKQREGPIGNVLFGYNDSLTKIGDYEDMTEYNRQRQAAATNITNYDAPY